ncbi:MAG: nucleoside-diphosphate kinase [Terrimicrobiaceae bacterium]|nr:nucleoside-diphosphate kinase [Terrimicrobiaceae bacterium]
METTLVLLKPDCVAGRKVGEVIKRFEDAGFQIRGAKMFVPGAEILKEHYAHLLAKPFFPDLEAFMQSTPVVALALASENAVERVRTIIGPTDSKKADPGTVRGDFGVDVMVNIVHASDSNENAAIELKRFFAPDELFDYAMHYTTTARSAEPVH